MTMFCSKCGKEVYDGITYCPFCGDKLKFSSNNNTASQHEQTLYAVSDRNEGIALILSLLIPGVGQMYVGKIARGIAFILSGLLIFVSMIFCYILVGVSFNDTNTLDAGIIAVTAVTMMAYLAIWIYSMYDAYQLAQQYNDYYYRNHQKPW
ncbi:MAG: zinc ribbon domain-containing protein [Candidatus Cloacimonetes bacterium]|nr:zinc ribbon domain-containing protein [Candidatus Cloacimonadota bacterium]